MKKAFFAIVAIMFFGSTGAQIYVGGGIEFWDNNDDHRTSISFTPEVGYRVSKHFAFGTAVGYEYSKEKGFHSDTYIARPYLKHYVYSFKGFDLLWEATLEFCYYDPSNSSSGYCIGIGAKPGISYTINKHFCISAYIGFFGYRHCEKEFIHPEFESGLGLKLKNELAFTFHYLF